MDTFFTFDDHRQLLKFLFDERKKRSRAISHRFMAQRLGVTSSATFPQILSGKTNVSAKVLPKLVRIFNMDDAQAEYFTALVQYEGAKKAVHKNYYREEIFRLRSMQATKVGAQHYEFYRQWYYSAVWAHIALCPFDGDYGKLAKTLEPPITEAQARKAVGVLHKIGFIEKDSTGSYRRVHPTLTSGEKAAQLESLRVFHKQTIELAKRAVDSIPRENRTISTVTMGLSQEALAEIEECIARCRKVVLEAARRATAADRIYQLNIQLFPLSKWPEKASP